MVDGKGREGKISGYSQICDACKHYNYPSNIRVESLQLHRNKYLKIVIPHSACTGDERSK